MLESSAFLPDDEMVSQNSGPLKWLASFWFPVNYTPEQVRHFEKHSLGVDLNDSI